MAENEEMMKDIPENLPEETLDDDALDSVAGGANNNRVETEGTVVSTLPNARFQVDIGGQTITANISAKLRMNYIRILPGDRVKVESSPDGQSARVTYRYKN